MELKELLNRMCLPAKQKLNDEELIKNEENNISEVITNVRLINRSFLKKKQILSP